MLGTIRAIATVGILVAGLMVNSEKAYGDCWCLQLIVDAPLHSPHGYRCNNNASNLPSPTLEACEERCKYASGGNWKTYGACEDEKACKYYKEHISGAWTNEPPPRCKAINY